MLQTIKKTILPLYKLYYDLRWLAYRRNHPDTKLVIGSSGIAEPGWFETDVLILDVTQEAHFRHFFTGRPIRMVFAEHVLEHLTAEQIELMARNIHKYSGPDVNIRVAVPDGFHADPQYIESVRPGGTGAGADDHKHLFTYRSLPPLFGKHGYRAILLEYWDEDRQFHTTYRNDGKGTVRRSLVNDARNADGRPHYTSLIVDFTKV